MKRWLGIAPQRWLGIMLLAMGLTALSVSVASAHGEAAQETFLRLQTVTFFDTQFSTDHLKVGDEFTITGKIKVLESWPVEVLGEPRQAYMTIGGPGPQVVLKDSRMGDVFTPGGVFLEKGKVYEYKLSGIARQAGRFHFHPKMNFEGAGPLQGPGQWVTIEPSGTPFVNPITLANGQTIDLERYGLGNVIGWHVITLGLGVAWLGYWIRKPILARAAPVAAGENLITRQDRRVSIGFVVLAALVLIGGNLYTYVQYPTTIPLQINRVAPPPVKDLQAVRVTTNDVKYNPQTHTLTVKVDVTNTSAAPIDLQQFVVSHVSFQNKALAPNAAHTITADPAGPINAGETRSLTLTVTDPIWEQERLELIPINEVQTVLAGMLDFADSAGQHSYVTVKARVVPEGHVLHQGMP